MQVNGSVIAITGSASGLGLATARRLVKDGATVALIDLPTSDGEAVAKELGDQALFAPGDVTDEVSFAAAFELLLGPEVVPSPSREISLPGRRSLLGHRDDQ